MKEQGRIFEAAKLLLEEGDKRFNLLVLRKEEGHVPVPAQNGFEDLGGHCASLGPPLLVAVREVSARLQSNEKILPAIVLLDKTVAPGFVGGHYGDSPQGGCLQVDLPLVQFRVLQRLLL